MFLKGFLYSVVKSRDCVVKSYSKLKEFADDNIEFDENDKKFSKEDYGKGEIARYEQFLVFPTLFSKDLYRRHIKTRACFGKG